ncbi:MAG TPA: glycoside hydrolase family 44 protein [Anaerolineaceae bacterium]|nr:glycoside hydrolase family 44 protein [Anaerolineaceae bacterium]
MSRLLLAFLFLFSLLPVHTVQAQSLTPIYSDTLASGWSDWSWNVSVNWAHAATVHSGSAAVAVTFTQGWDGLQLGWQGAQPLELESSSSLVFWVNGGASGGQTVSVSAGNDCVDATLEITLTANTWTRYEIPLQPLGNPARITHITWFNNTGSSRPVFYLDDIGWQSSAKLTTAPLAAGPALNVNASSNAPRTLISPYIYGMSFTGEELAEELQLPVRRWGGNSVTRYNWQNDTSNRGLDWYFENIPEDNPIPALLPDGSTTDRFVEQDRRTNTATALTVPIIGWVAKSRVITCGFSVAKYGAQQDADWEWRPDCGNGILSSTGQPITTNDPADTSTAITPVFIQSWIAHLTAKYGTAANGGVRFYILDNEPMLWNSTHRDVHPTPTSYDEIMQRSLAYAAAIKAADPSAQVIGPAVWGWTAYFYSALDAAPGGAWWNNPLDRLAHGNTPFVEWYLQQMQAYQQQHGIRLLDYLDVHYYPQAGEVFSGSAGDADTQALRLRSTRALWDTTYMDESWIGEPVYLIPRMKAWVADNYPGTKTAIGEYSWGALCHISGALAQADVLGIFGREGLDMAELWGPPEPDEPGAFAFRMYLNYDGAGSKFGNLSLSTSSADEEDLAVYAAVRGSDMALTIMVINKTAQNLESPLTIQGLVLPTQAQIYRYDGLHLSSIQHLADIPLSTAQFTLAYPAQSITLLIIQQPVWRTYLPVITRISQGLNTWHLK